MAQITPSFRPWPVLPDGTILCPTEWRIHSGGTPTPPREEWPSYDDTIEGRPPKDTAPVPLMYESLATTFARWYQNTLFWSNQDIANAPVKRGRPPKNVVNASEDPTERRKRLNREAQERFRNSQKFLKSGTNPDMNDGTLLNYIDKTKNALRQNKFELARLETQLANLQKMAESRGLAFPSGT